MHEEKRQLILRTNKDEVPDEVKKEWNDVIDKELNSRLDEELFADSVEFYLEAIGRNCK